MQPGLLCRIVPLAALLVACGRPTAPVDNAATTPSLAELLGAGQTEGYAVASGSRRFDFPADHGPHDGYRNEWWYVTGNLDTAGGRRFGYELTLFRFALAPAAVDERKSAWATHHIMVGHLALTDVAGKRFHSAVRVARAAAGQAGAEAGPLHVWLYDWSIKRRPGTDTGAAGTGTWQVLAATDDLQLSLALTPLTAPVLNGNAGLSRKSADPGNASWYYSLPRLRTTGQLVVGDETFEVTGLSWIDREWSSSALARDQAGWDWFALQLDNGSSLMLYRLRQADGAAAPASAGTLVSATGESKLLARDDVEVEVLGHWASPRGGVYPSGWRISVPGELLHLHIKPVLADQELDARVRYWEGAVDVSGTSGTQSVSGRGYVELTGYAHTPGPDD